MINKNQRVFGLDAIRAFAILLVVVAHFFASTGLRIGGAVGVELFFVLSGFLIGGILIKAFQTNGATFNTLKDFWIRRWFRTIPNYAFFLLLFGAIQKCEVSEFILYPIFLQNFAWPINEFFEISWSLAVEEWFYLSFPLILWLVSRRSKFDLRKLIIVILMFTTIPLMLRIYTAESFGLGESRKIVIFRLDSMMYGVMASGVKIFFPPVWGRLSKSIFAICGLLLIFAGGLWLDSDTTLAKTLVFPMMSLGSALVISPMERFPSNRIFAANIITFMSVVSYSVYLLHMPLFFFWESIFMGHLNNEVKIAGRLTLMVIVFLVSWIPYRLIEMPFLSLRKRFAGRTSSNHSQNA
jgi:peptidoglycan/LPS O-acetylase OafA/YrhL